MGFIHHWRFESELYIVAGLEWLLELSMAFAICGRIAATGSGIWHGTVGDDNGRKKKAPRRTVIMGILKYF